MGLRDDQLDPDPGYEAFRHLDDEVIFIHNEAREVVFVSPSVENLLGYSEDAFKTYRTWELIHPEDLPHVIETATALRAAPGSSYRNEVRVRHANGHYVWCETVGRNMLHDELRGVVNTLRDVSERRAAEERLHYQAMHDELTGLPNRRCFLEQLEPELAGTRHTGIGVLIVDLDGFKAINDQLGHAAGDELLHRCANEISGALRSGDSAARIGGDEFAVLCRRLSDEDALVFAAERIRSSAGRTYELCGGPGSVTLSIGGAIALPGDDRSALLKAADRALYSVKQGGRDGVEVARRTG